MEMFTFKDRDLLVEYEIIPGEYGTSDQYGAKYEPDWPESIEIWEIKEDGKVVELSKEDLKELESYILSIHNAPPEPYFDEC